MAGYVGRLAPSPTGLLHLGHARTFLFAQERARAAAGELWLRDEDLDAQRARAEFALALREDLHWLGVTWVGEVRQSERLPLYRKVMQRLLALRAVYPCDCSRKDLLQAAQAPHEDADDEPVYNGRCRTRLRRETSEANPMDAGALRGINYRFRVPDGETIRFPDALAGPQAFVGGCAPDASFGDFVVWRKEGLPSYQLACVVDDAAMGITEVVRGRDLLTSTARQILLQRALGLSTPVYAHCDLVRDEAGLRLAKRHDALSLRALRDRGLSPQEVRAMLSWVPSPTGTHRAAS